MEKNLATWDRAIRVIIGLMLIGIAITGFYLTYKLMGLRTG